MSLISLHRKYSFVDYQNSLCSFAAIITLLVVLTSIVLPFVWILKVGNHKFSSANDLIAYEQPLVKFKYKYIVIAENAMDNEEKVTLCSSFQALEEPKGHGSCDKIKIKEKDENFDGVPDSIEFSVSFATQFKFGIKSLSLALFLDSRLDQNHCHFQVPSAVIIQKKFVGNINDRRIVIKGSLQPNQKHALVCPFFLRNIKSHFFHDELKANQTDLDKFKFDKIQENLERNPMHFYFQETSTDLEEFDLHETTVTVKMSVPEISTRYKKTFWQIVNDVWINYIAIFVVVYFVCNFILNHLFENRLLIARKTNFLNLKNKEM